MESYIAFILASIILLMIPGPAVVYIVTRSIDQGRGAGLISMLGIHTGTFFQIAAAAFGLSALLLSSAIAFSTVKYLGAAYLVYLGIRKLLNKDAPPTLECKEKQPLRRLYYEGVLVSTLNPKTALFFFAFLPQFIDPKFGSASLQILMLGLLFIILGLISDGLYAILAGAVGNRLKQGNLFRSFQQYIAGSVYILLGVATAFSGSGKVK